MTGAAREKILGRVRAGLGAKAQDESRRASLKERLRRHARGTVPSRSDGGAAARRALFARMVEAANATLATVSVADDVPDAVTAYLREHNLPASVRMGAAPLLAEIAWDRAPALERAHGPAEENDTAGLSVATAAIAETGTLMLSSGSENPTSLNFLPPTHIVVVPASCIHGAYEDAWDALRAIHGGTGMPRAVNLITGPSRTADIEQQLLMGAHGPKRLHVIIVEDA